MPEYLWILWTGKREWGFYRDENSSPKYMTEEEAKTAYDSLFKVEPTKRLKGFSLSNTSVPT